MADKTLITFGIGLFALGWFGFLIPIISKSIEMFTKINPDILPFIYGTAIFCGIAAIVIGARSR
jgi:hypothetical protein